MLRDAIGRDWQCGTIQVDLNMPMRLGAFYIGPDGEKTVPVMIHRAMFGSLERFTGILIEHYAGHLPLWLSPVQVMVGADRVRRRCLRHQGARGAEALGLRAEADLRNEKINYKVREHSLAKVPVMFVVGKREAEEGTVSVRRLGSQAQQVLSLDEAIRAIAAEAVPPDLAKPRRARRRVIVRAAEAHADIGRSRVPGAPGVATSDGGGGGGGSMIAFQSLWRGRAGLHYHLDLLCLAGSTLNLLV